MLPSAFYRKIQANIIRKGIGALDVFKNRRGRHCTVIVPVQGTNVSKFRGVLLLLTLTMIIDQHLML